MSDSAIVYGIHAVHAAVKQSPQDVEAVWLAVDWRRHQRLRHLAELIEGMGLSLTPSDRDQLRQLAGSEHHQGVVARCRVGKQSPVVLEELVVQRGRELLLLVLDGVKDPHNLGACLRSAEAAGVDAVVVPRDRAVGLSAAVRKVASGSAERVAFVTVTNLARTLRQLKEAGVWLVGAAGEAGDSLYQQDLTGPLALVLGAEEDGLRRLTREICDVVTAIPMRGAVESLNVSVAAAVFLFEARRQRDQQQGRSRD